MKVFYDNLLLRDGVDVDPGRREPYPYHASRSRYQQQQRFVYRSWIRCDHRLISVILYTDPFCRDWLVAKLARSVTAKYGI